MFILFQVSFKPNTSTHFLSEYGPFNLPETPRLHQQHECITLYTSLRWEQLRRSLSCDLWLFSILRRPLALPMTSLWRRVLLHAFALMFRTVCTKPRLCDSLQTAGGARGSTPDLSPNTTLLPPKEKRPSSYFFSTVVSPLPPSVATISHICVTNVLLFSFHSHSKSLWSYFLCGREAAAGSQTCHWWEKTHQPENTGCPANPQCNTSTPLLMTNTVKHQQEHEHELRQAFCTRASTAGQRWISPVSSSILSCFQRFCGFLMILTFSSHNYKSHDFKKAALHASPSINGAFADMHSQLHEDLDGGTDLRLYPQWVRIHRWLKWSLSASVQEALETLHLLIRRVHTVFLWVNLKYKDCLKTLWIKAESLNFSHIVIVWLCGDVQRQNHKEK